MGVMCIKIIPAPIGQVMSLSASFGQDTFPICPRQLLQH